MNQSYNMFTKYIFPAVTSMPTMPTKGTMSSIPTIASMATINNVKLIGSMPRMLIVPAIYYMAYMPTVCL